MNTASTAKQQQEGILTAGSIPNGIVQHFQFAARKIVGMTQAKLSNVSVYAKAKFQQTAFAGYKEHIEAFVWATYASKKINTTYSGYPMIMRVVNDTPFALPPVQFTLKENLSSDARTKASMLVKNSGGREVVVGKKTTTYILSEWNEKTVKFLEKFGNPDFGVPAQYISPAAMGPVLIIYQIINMFLRTNSYPASAPGRTAAPRVFAEERKRERTDGNEKRKARILGTVPEMERMKEDTPEPEEAALVIHNEVLIAKPSPLPVSTSCGPISSLPYLPGLAFPYFSGLIIPDASFVRTTMLRHFFRNITTSAEVSPFTAFQTFKKDIGSFISTPEGLIIQHVLFGIDMALDAQAQLYLIFEDGVYLGYCLLGDGFRVFNQNKWKEVLGPDDLKVQVATWESHKSAVASFIRLMEGVDSLSKDISEISISGSSDVGYYLRDRPVSDAQIEELSAILRKMNFARESYQSADPMTLIKSFPIFMSDDEGIDVEPRPIYLGAPYPILSNPEPWCQELLSYGSMAPSILTAGGDRILPGTRKMVGEGEKRTDEVFIFSYKSVLAAYNDWRQFRESGVAQMKFKERAKESRCIVVSKERKSFWDMLANGSDKFRKVGNVGRGKDKPVVTKKSSEVVEFDDDLDLI